MTTVVILASLAAIGVSYGYEPGTDGQLEYIVQIEPQLLDGLTQGHDITSEIPRGLNVRHFRVTIGTAKLPRLAAADAGSRNVSNRLPTDAGEPAGEEATEVRSGYQPLAGGSGEYVVEITPMGLNDLHSHDLTGDVPAGVPVTRMRVSTQPGSAPAAAPPSAAIPVAAAQPASEYVATTSGVSAEPRQTPAPPPAGPPVGSDLADVPLSNSAGSNLVDVPPSDQDQFDPTGISASDSPRINKQPDWPLDPVTAGNPPALDAQPKKQIQLPPPPSQSAAPIRGPSMESNSAGRERRAPRPEQFEPDPQAASLPGKNVTYDDQSRTEHQTAKPSASTQRVTNALQAAEQDMNEEMKENPWLSLTLFAALCASLGANVYLVWIAWDARNRSRMLLDKFHAGELSLS